MFSCYFVAKEQVNDFDGTAWDVAWLRLTVRNLCTCAHINCCIDMYL